MIDIMEREKYKKWLDKVEYSMLNIFALALSKME